MELANRDLFTTRTSNLTLLKCFRLRWHQIDINARARINGRVPLQTNFGRDGYFDVSYREKSLFTLPRVHTITPYEKKKNGSRFPSSKAIAASFQCRHINKIQNHSIDIVQNFGKNKVNTQTLAKIQVRAVFLKRDNRRYFLSKFIEICMETPCK